MQSAAEEETRVHQRDLCAKHIGSHVSGTTGTIDFAGVLERVSHVDDDELRSWQNETVRTVRTRTMVTISGHDFLLARGSEVVVR